MSQPSHHYISCHFTPQCSKMASAPCYGWITNARLNSSLPDEDDATGGMTSGALQIFTVGTRREVAAALILTTARWYFPSSNDNDLIGLVDQGVSHRTPTAPCAPFSFPRLDSRIHRSGPDSQGHRHHYLDPTLQRICFVPIYANESCNGC